MFIFGSPLFILSSSNSLEILMCLLIFNKIRVNVKMIFWLVDQRKESWNRKVHSIQVNAWLKAFMHFYEVKWQVENTVLLDYERIILYYLPTQEIIFTLKVHNFFYNEILIFLKNTSHFILLANHIYVHLEMIPSTYGSAIERIFICVHRCYSLLPFKTHAWSWSQIMHFH